MVCPITSGDHNKQKTHSKINTTILPYGEIKIAPNLAFDIPHRSRECHAHKSHLHRVSKNVPHLTCYNLDIHGSITIIFGTSVTEKVCNQNVLYIPTSPNLSFCTT